MYLNSSYEYYKIEPNNLKFLNDNYYDVKIVSKDYQDRCFDNI